MNTTALSRTPRARVTPPALVPAHGPVVGVRTTRIYCRPFCRSGRAPRPENCLPFLNVEVARSAGYRPCKKCRPDGGGDAKASREVETFRYGVASTPLGFAFIATGARGVAAIYLLDRDDPGPGLARFRGERPVALMVEDGDSVAVVLPRIHEFLGGVLDEAGLMLDVSGTPFQVRVWDALRAIPRGTTRTYGTLARELGIPGAARAVGAACKANPVALLIPCHRVVRAGGGLGGFEWGLDRKRALLDLEKDQLARA